MRELDEVKESVRESGLYGGGVVEILGLGFVEVRFL